MAAPAAAELKVNRPQPDTLLLQLSGSWQLGGQLPTADAARRELAQPPPVARVAFDTGGLGAWDSGLLVFFGETHRGLPPGGSRRRSIRTPRGGTEAAAPGVPENQRAGVTRGGKRASFLERVADRAFDQLQGFKETLAFIGEATLAFSRCCGARRTSAASTCSRPSRKPAPQALPIVSLISLLVGMILAFVAAIQLKMFGAQIYVADLVGIGMVRVMGAIMTGIIMAGRTGAAFAAQLGTMQVNEEIDALETLGLSPMEFLVLPRMLALMLMMPLLCVLCRPDGGSRGDDRRGGDARPGCRWSISTRRGTALNLTHFLDRPVPQLRLRRPGGSAGCLRGMQCGRSASAVGEAATSAVVTGIVSIVVATAIITVSCQVLGI